MEDNMAQFRHMWSRAGIFFDETGRWGQGF